MLQWLFGKKSGKQETSKEDLFRQLQIEARVIEEQVNTVLRKHPHSDKHNCIYDGPVLTIKYNTSAIWYEDDYAAINVFVKLPDGLKQVFKSIHRDVTQYNKGEWVNSLALLYEEAKEHEKRKLALLWEPLDMQTKFNA